MNESLILIPARAGSKGIRNKNMSLIDNIPLLEFTIRSAIASKIRGRICLSTDSIEMRDFGISCGIEAPFLRPFSLAQDDSTSISVINHAINWYSNNIHFHPDYIIFLQPTSPFRSPESISDSLNQIIEKEADCLISVNKVHNHPCEYIMKKTNGFTYVMNPPKKAGRQNFPPVYFINGAIYICKIDFIKTNNELFNSKALLYDMDTYESIDIDEPEDLVHARCIYINNKEKIYWINEAIYGSI